MTLTGQTVALLVTDEGREILRLASVDVADSALVVVAVAEAEEMGLWIRVPPGGQLHFFLLLWQYIAGVDVPGAMGRVVGWMS